LIAASLPQQRPAHAKLLSIDAHGSIRHEARTQWLSRLARGDVVVANDAMTLPASLAGVHVPSGRAIEVRLAQRRSLDADAVHEFLAIVFGEGDHRVRTEDREAPPPLAPGDRLDLGPLRAIVTAVPVPPRLASIRFEGSAAQVWAGLAAHGRPIQYAYVANDLALWDVWTAIAAVPAAFEAPSAGFVLDWHALARMREHGVAFATLTHAAGISSTGDAALDALLPFDEPYDIPEATVRAVAHARAAGGRVVAVGTTVVRALEAAAGDTGELQAGRGMATRRIDAGTRLRVVDAILSGTHEPGTSHHALLHAFTDTRTLREADRALEEYGYRTHEFGDSVFIERRTRR
jgi:S-adenosylmethionine:tRNA ribosyltransferase-isomerase